MASPLWAQLVLQYVHTDPKVAAMKQRVQILLLIVHVFVVGGIILPRLHAQEHGNTEQVWRYGSTGLASATDDPHAADGAGSSGSCLWPQAGMGKDGGMPEDDAGPLVMGHAFCLRILPSRTARRPGSGLSYRT